MAQDFGCSRKDRPTALLRRLRDSRSGATAITTALAMVGLTGFVGLGAEGGLWYFSQRTLQGAADSGALAAAIALGSSGTGNLAAEAKAVAAKFGLTDGTSGTKISVNHPPTAGNYKGNNNAVEVIISQPQSKLFSAVAFSGKVTTSARAVALQSQPGTDCVLALDKGASASAFSNGTTDVKLIACGLADNSNSSSALTLVGGATLEAKDINLVGGYSETGNGSITTTNGIHTGMSTISDPYATVPIPPYSGCNQNNYSPGSHKTASFSGGGVFCNGIKITAGSTVNLSNGVYVIDRGALDVAGGATLNVDNATVVLTSSSGSNYATADVHGGAVINATPPSSGDTAGMAFFQDQNAPSGVTDNFSGGTTQNIKGAIYFPRQIVDFAGGTATGSGCMQLIADEVDFKGNANFEINCTGVGVKAIGSSSAKLVE
jgi:Flp pilus assembly protein TadG